MLPFLYKIMYLCTHLLNAQGLSLGENTSCGAAFGVSGHGDLCQAAFGGMWPPHVHLGGHPHPAYLSPFHESNS